MLSTALKLLRKSANYTGGAATGMALAAAAGGPAGALGLAGLLGLVALCVVTETATEALEPDPRLSRIELWLEELVRRHGRLDAAVTAIAEGREANQLVSRKAADTLRSILSAPEDRVSTLAEHDSDVRTLLGMVSARLNNLDARTVAALERQAELLGSIDGAVRGVAERVDGLHQKFDELRAQQDKEPSEEELAATAIDEADNCRLRSERLQGLFDQMEYINARGFAERCDAWLLRTGDTLPAAAHAQLLERLIEEATVRSRTARESDRAEALERLRQLGQRAQPLLARLDEPERLRVSSHAAYVASVVDGTSAGLAQLDGRHDPYSIRRRLAMLCDAERYGDGADMIRGTTPLPEWVDKGIVVFARCGEWSEVERVLTWALANTRPGLQQMCRLLFVESVILDRPDESMETRTPLAADARVRFNRSHELLWPLVEDVLSLAEPRHELDYSILRLATEVAVRLDKTAEVQRLVPKLARRRPLDISLGVLAVRGRIEAGADWPQRLRIEGEASFDRRLVAAALEGRHSGTRDAAFRAALRLAEEASTDDQRKRLHGLLMELAQQLGDSAEKQLEALAPSLVGAEDRQARLWSATRLFKAGRTDGIDELLQQLRDPTDPLWLQIHGQRLLQNGDPVKGVAELSEAARILDQPDVLGGVAGLALAHKQWGVAATLLDRFLVLKPGDPRARANLAMTLHRLEQHGRAADLLAVLSDEKPDDPSFGVNAAVCLIKSGRPDDAVKVLTKVCERPEPPLQAVIGLAQVLVERDQPKVAFELLSRHRARFWDEYQFVGAYWSIAFAAEEESAGHDGFVQMRVLQAAGAAPSDVVVEKTIDDLVEMSKAHHERERHIATAILQGRLPWLMAAEWSRDPAFRGWSQRTGERLWVFEHPVNLANATIYCTNGFTAATVESSRHLIPIESPDRGQPVVVDLSALITLQKLGMLDTAATYCGRFHVPDAYLFKMFRDNDQLRPHQPSRRTVLSVLRTALSERRVLVEMNDEGSDYRRVDEHYPIEQARAGVYHLADLHAAIKGAGTATDAQLSRLAAVAHRPATASASHQALQPGDPLSVSLSTLSTLHGCGLLETVVAQFRVHLDADDQQVVQGESLWFDRQEQLRTDHRTLWEFLRDDPRVERHVGHGASADEPDDGEDASGDRGEVSLEALLIADRLSLPFLVDDRCLQATSLNARPTSPSSAFSTVQLLAALADNGHITLERYAESVRTLMGFRYRFIAPASELLVHWARKALSAVPGPDLQVVATYLRACLRDPGLFGGFEPTDPPSTIAMKFHQAIEIAVGEFLGALWCDESVPEDRAMSFTQWGLTHLLPSPPAVMEPRFRFVGDLGMPMFWSSFLVRLALSSRSGLFERARRGVEVVGESLGMPAHEVIRVITETIDGLGNQRR